MTPGGNPSWEMKPGTVLGSDRFLLIEPLGQGGMGVVWLAHDQRLDEDVALKLVPPEIRTDAGALEDLRRETLRSRKLSHPNIIRLHDLNEFAGEPPFISMEFVDGQSVAAWKAQQPHRLFPWEQIRTLTRQLCDALEYAHEEKVVHRDLKPANMMLDRRGRLKLANFGLAAVVSELTSRVSIKANTSGTPAYMSPQQMDGRTPRVTDDIYALGATLYELLTSKPPFYHGDIPHQVRNLPPDPVEQRLAELELTNAVPPYVSALIMACLAKDPAQRPQSAAAVAEWLQLGGQSVTSALASEITQRSQPAAPTTTASSSRATPPSAPPSVPILESEIQTEKTEALPPQEESSRPQKSPWKKRALVVLGILMLLGILAAVLKPGSDDSTGGAEDQAETDTVSAPTMAPGTVLTLFNGRNLDGWSILGPTAWRAEAGVIKGAVQGRQRSYLVWDQRVTDFDLTFEYKPALQRTADGHHGLFYRATMPQPGGIASGLAMPLEPGGNNGILLVGNNGRFDERYIDRPEALRTDDWNQIRVRVDGTRILQSINGVTTYEADRPDLVHARAGNQIAFEIWSTAANGERAVEIRNIVIRPARPSQTTSSVVAGPDGWENLFVPTRGDTEAFRGFKQSGFPSASWVVENGTLKSIPNGPKVDLITKGLYGDFEFQMVYEISPGSNSGILYRATEEGQNSFDTGPEMQLLGEGDIRGIDADNKRNGALYGVLATAGSPGRTPPGGNFLRIRMQNGRVEHSLNEQVVLQYNWDSPELRQSISRSTFKHPGFMKAAEGHIVIQHHGSEITIRQMRVRRL